MTDWKAQQMVGGKALVQTKWVQEKHGVASSGHRHLFGDGF